MVVIPEAETPDELDVQKNRGRIKSLAVYRSKVFESEISDFGNLEGIGKHLRVDSPTSPSSCVVEGSGNHFRVDSPTSVSVSIDFPETSRSVVLIEDKEGEEESDDSCPVRAARKEAEKQPKASSITQMMRVKDMFMSVCGLAFMLYILIRYREPWDFILISVHPIIRSILDYAYDCASLQGREKAKTCLQLICLNFMQLRLIFDLYLAYSAEIVFSFSLIMTQVTDALFKRVPQGAICVRRILIQLHGHGDFKTLINSIEILNLLIPALLLVACCFLGTVVMARFEVAMNSESAKISRKIYSFFFFDFALRVLLFGVIWYLARGQQLLLSFFAFIYTTRLSLFLYHFISRGYVYSPAEGEETTGNISAKRLAFIIMFSFFPAGFIQSFTDFPFNAEFSSTRILFIFHQVLSNCEFLGIAILLNTGIIVSIEDYMDVWLIHTFNATTTILMIWKVFLFVYYLKVKVPEVVQVAQHEKMTKMSTERSLKTSSSKGLEDGVESFKE